MTPPMSRFARPIKGMTMRFLDACSRLPVDATPVWFMRQAGRYLAEYRALRDQLLVPGVVQRPNWPPRSPCSRAALRLDAAIIFADILLPLEPMGIAFDFVRRTGPHRAPRPRAADVDGVRGSTRRKTCPTCSTPSAWCARARWPTPLIGFAGAPFTLASYSSKAATRATTPHTKALMYGPAGVGPSWSFVRDVVVDYLDAQIEAGAQVVQLFDSWVGALRPRLRADSCCRTSRHIFDAVRAAACR